MKNIETLNDNFIVEIGSILRIYKVKRFDVIKTHNDLLDESKNEMDYYDLMLIKVPRSGFWLVNITNDSDNRGLVVTNFDQIEVVTADVIKKYFLNHAVYLLDRLKAN